VLIVGTSLGVVADFLGEEDFLGDLEKKFIEFVSLNLD